jgi:hypothetical protein
MRIIVDIPDALYRRLQSKAAQEKRSIEGLILRAVEAVLRVRPKRKDCRVCLPLIKSKLPGTLDLGNAQIYELIPFP